MCSVHMDAGPTRYDAGPMWELQLFGATAAVSEDQVENIYMSVFGQMYRAWRMWFSCQGVGAYCFLRHSLPCQESSGITDELKDLWETYIVLAKAMALGYFQTHEVSIDACVQAIKSQFENWIRRLSHSVTPTLRRELQPGFLGPIPEGRTSVLGRRH